ncbi:protein kinase [Sphingomonas sp. RP10(2022)]|uniref:Protein kinase n=1 Tax=Sphingomonas liriopis TaxID=2949094 RepID=A0A9X2HP95_9SPHN|nr:serine/threonine-protein kinase [Sphingomonas liriopis]MCP3734648.1 protein kinase [Sphingomonas liriopis]
MTTAASDDVTLWERIAREFDRIQPMPQGARAAALAKCDPIVRTRVEAMLASLEQTGILDQADQTQASAPVPASLAPGAQVGPFTIEAFIGRGGMGEVYRAIRTDAAFQQRVALKLLRIDAVTDAALFARERRLLSKLEHPAIARLIDGGITAEGRSWMAMAYVEGQSLDRWCKERGASLDERLRLFGEVCDAVGFAHANLIVHRDLKPANILVDGRGRAQLLDFGIAKLIDDAGDEQTLVTSMMMTPHYAAPEQLEDGPITVATDVHALGVILYELLSGSPPWRAGGSLPAVVQRIVADDPEPPSRAAAAHARPPVAPAALRGDLDAIVLKALRKEPHARYASVAALADDIRRSRDLRPVAARAGSRRYRMQRYVRRNRWAIAAVSAVLVAIAAGTIGVAIQAHRAAVQRDAALAEARRSDSIVQTLTLMLGQSGNAGELTLKQALDASAARLLRTLDRSARSGRTVNVLSDLYVNTQDAKGSYDLTKAALARGIGGDDPVVTAEMQANLADAAMATGAKDDVPGILDRAEAVLAADRERNAVPLQQIVATRAGLARRQRDYDRAIGLLMDNMAAAERAFAGNESALLTRYNNLLVYLIEANRLAQAGPIFARAERVMALPGQRDTIQSLGIELIHGGWQLRGGDPATAERTFATVAARRRALYGATPGLANDLTWLGRARLAQRNFTGAMQALTEARPLAVKYLGATSLPTMNIDMAIAQTLAELHRTDDARRALAGVRQAVAAMPSPNPVVPQLALVDAVIAINDHQRAAALAAAGQARAVLTAMGPAGAYGLMQLRQIDQRIAAMR